MDRTERQAGDEELCREVDEHPHAEHRREAGDQEEENPVINPPAKARPANPMLQNSIYHAIEQRKAMRDIPVLSTAAITLLRRTCRR